MIGEHVHQVFCRANQATIPNSSWEMQGLVHQCDVPKPASPRHAKIAGSLLISEATSLLLRVHMLEGYDEEYTRVWISYLVMER